MALVLKLRPGRAFEVGGVRITVTYARRGEVRLVVEAPPAVRVRPLPREASPPDGHLHDGEERDDLPF